MAEIYVFSGEQGTAHAYLMDQVEPEVVEPNYIEVEFRRLASMLGHVSIPDGPEELPEPSVRGRTHDKFEESTYTSRQ